MKIARFVLLLLCAATGLQAQCGKAFAHFRVAQCFVQGFVDFVNRRSRCFGWRIHGKPTLAQAGGKYPDKLDEALHVAKTLVKA